MQGLLVTASKRSDGSFEYNANTVVLLSELTKLIFALVCLPRGTQLHWKVSLPFAIPAILYAIQNNLVFVALQHLTPSEYQVLNNTKLMTTSIVYRFFMGRHLRILQWFALTLLALGMTLSVEVAQPSAAMEKTEVSHSIFTGVMIMVVNSWCSAFAGVTNELFIKRASSLYEGNVYLYGYSSLVCIGFGRHVLGSPSSALKGFDLYTWCIVICNAFLGQSISFIMRYADSIVKIYAVCGSMAFSGMLSYLLFGIFVRRGVILSYFVCGISCCLFYMTPERLMQTDIQFFADMTGRPVGTEENACQGTGTQENAKKKSLILDVASSVLLSTPCIWLQNHFCRNGRNDSRKCLQKHSIACRNDNQVNRLVVDF